MRPSRTQASKGEIETVRPAVLGAFVADALRGLILQCRPNQAVFRQGEPADSVYYIQSGKVRISVVSAHGKEGVVAILGPGEFFGEGALIGQAVRTGSAVAMSPSAVIKVARKAMLRLIRLEAAVSGAFIEFLLSRNAQIEADLIDHLFNSSERRLARVLLLLANFGKDDKMEAVVPRISQEMLAAKVGTTRSRINFFMNKFRRLGLVEYDGAQKVLKVRASLLDVIVRD